MADFKMPGFPDTPAKRAYQVIISRLEGDRISDLKYRERLFQLVEKGIGGFILFGGTRQEIKPFIADLQSRSGIPLFIASDIERGVGQQVTGMTSFSSQMAFAAAIDRTRDEDAKLLQDSIEAIASEARDIGINMPLIPVLDVNRDPDNPIICTRAFSDDPGLTSWFGSRYIQILEKNGLISCAKHFPGHGDTATDSHIELPVIRKTSGQLMDTDITPFRRAIEASVGSIMVGHLSIPSFDTRPASLSRKIMTDLLRDYLGFKGLVLTDALNMHALREFGNLGVECLKAGADILLHPDDPDAMAFELISALDDKRLDPAIIESAVGKIIHFKAQMGNAIVPGPDFGKNALLSKKISQRAITLIKDPQALLPIRDTRRFHVIFGGESGHFSNSPLRDLPKNPENSDLLLIALFTSVSAWRGSSGISYEERLRLASLISNSKRSIVVSFGSPYVLRYFRDADVLLAAYDPTVQAQEALLNCLCGTAPFTGRLPVQMPEVQP